jgi:anaerobic magnesium-protoporphyrin IX monomethyl ester cyclase
LIFPYLKTDSPSAILFPPLGEASLAAQLRQLGLKTHIFDCTFDSFKHLQNDLEAYQPDIIGIYSMIGQSRNTFRIADMAQKMFPGSLLVAGGPMPTLYPARYTRQFDLVFRGEADLSFPHLCRDYFEQGLTRQRLGELPLRSYDGLFIQDEGMQVENPTVHYPEKIIRSFPLPDRSNFDHATYQKTWLEKDGSKTASMIITLGCPFSCDFCSRPVFGSLYRRRELGAVFEEIEQIRDLGYDTLWIADDNFTLNLAFLEQFCQGMAGKNMGWSCLSRVTGIDERITRMMKEAGCRRVYLGLETGSQATL